jgi:hypothetical protein
MNYVVTLYHGGPNRGHTRWAVLCSKTRIYYFTARSGRRHAERFARTLNNNNTFLESKR